MHIGELNNSFLAKPKPYIYISEKPCWLCFVLEFVSIHILLLLIFFPGPLFTDILSKCLTCL